MTSSALDPSSYRPDVDGLRAIAVVLVMLFHAGIGVGGGFVGVDVFFVISGFLITRILLAGEEAWGRRLVEFWLRRIGRILPASLLVTAAALVAGFFILLPDDYAELARSAVSQQFLMANVFFCRATGYFGGQSARIPLLHLWSLAVEEQFYVVYPVLLWLLSRASRKVVCGALIMAALASFAWSEWTLNARPRDAFYLLPSRAWEILLGGLVVFAPSPSGRPRWVADALAGGGLAGIALAAWWFDETTRFPGRAALLPCAATALVIYANSVNPTWVGRALATRPFVFVGLISYSLYLWHWPVLAFLRYLWCGRPPGAFVQCGALSAAFVLAIASWRYVEVPFRRRTALPATKRRGIALVSSVSLLLAGALTIDRCQGLPRRFSPESLGYAAAKRSKAFLRSMSVDEIREGRLPRFGSADGSTTCLVWGDSHAMALIAGLDAACKSRGVRGVQATRIVTSPQDRMFMDAPGRDERDASFQGAVVDYALTHDVDIVVISCVWARFIQQAGFEEGFRGTIRRLTDAGIHVALVRDVARFPRDTDPPLLLCLASHRGQDVSSIGVLLASHTARNASGNAMLDRCADVDVTILDPTPAFVDDTGLWRAAYDGASMYRDDHHLSVEGSLRLAPMFESFFDERAAAGGNGAGRRGIAPDSPAP